MDIISNAYMTAKFERKEDKQKRVSMLAPSGRGNGFLPPATCSNLKHDVKNL